jgi:chitodextrinase
LPSAVSNTLTTANVPSAPIIGVATATGGTTAIIGYTASTSSGGAPITGYNIGSNPGGAVGRINTCGSGIISVTGLSANTVYNFYAYATNALGNSTNSSNSNNTATWTVPYTPTILVSTVTSGISANVVVRPGAYNGGGGPITYTVLTNPGGGQGTLAYCGVCASVVTVTGLNPANTYSFYTYASNSIGNSGVSPFLSTVTTFSTATAPTNIIATATGVNSALVGYTASTQTGSPITSYTVVTSPSGGFGFINTSGSGVISVSNLLPQTSYNFAVYATNQYGNSTTSSWSNSAITFGRPAAPVITAVTATGPTTALVGYTAPSNSGSVITSYTALTVPAGGIGVSNTCGSGVIAVSGIPIAATGYQFYVYATNAAGTGTTSSLSTSINMITTATAPVIVSAAPLSYNSAIVTFNASTTTGATITQYTAVSVPARGAGSIQPCLSASQQSIVVTGLVANTPYTFYVYASNLYGNSSSSTQSTQVTTYGPTTPPILNSVVGGPAGTAVVSYAPPQRLNGYPVTGYTVVSSPAGGYGTAPGCATSINVVGLIPGTSYNFSVYSTNAAGNSTVSNTSNTITLFGAPTPPVVAVASATGATTAIVGYIASTASGFTITSYTAVSSPPGGAGTVLTSSSGVITVTGLSPASIYSFQVYATNIYGTGTSVSYSNTITTYGVPGRPVIEVATATIGNTQALVGYIAPVNNNGYTITSYTALSSPAGGIGTINTCGSGVITVAGLQPNTTYSFTVYATNAIGNSTTSSFSNSVTTFGVPSTVTVNAATATGATSAIVGYNASTATGFTISYYTAISIPAGGIGTLVTTGSGVINVNGLQPLTSYNFYVYATNPYGNGSTSTLSVSNTATTYGVPYAPVIVAATATGFTSATVVYSITTNTNINLPVLQYTAISTPGNFTGTIFTSSGGTIVVNGLSTSTSYRFQVYATNALGTGTISTLSNTVTTYGSILFTTASSYNWVVPWGVTSVSVLAVGGGGGGQGSAIGTTGSNSWFITGTVLLAQGGGGGGYGSPNTGGFAGTATGAYSAAFAGGVGGYGQIGSNLAGGGGGAGGYTAAGGAGSTGTTGMSVRGCSSTGYGGGGGGVRVTNFPRGGGGGGVGVFGITSTYLATVIGGVTTASNGGGGAGGAGGLPGLCAVCFNVGYGGQVGGGGGGTNTSTVGGAGGGGGGLAYVNNWNVIPQNTYFVNVGSGGSGGGAGIWAGGPGSTGTVRIIWPGCLRYFPGNCAGYP